MISVSSPDGGKKRGEDGRLMVKRVTITMDDWLYTEVESRKGDRTRSETCTELMVRGIKVTR